MSDDADDEDEGLLGDPERFETSLGPDVPQVDVPEVDIPSVPGAAEAGEVDVDEDAFDVDVDPELSRTFWRLVVVFDVAFLAMSLGPMFVFFRGDWDTGGPLFVLGAAAFVYGVREYYQFRHGDGPADDDESANGDESADDDEPVDDNVRADDE